MKREGERISKTTKKWIVIALGTLILALTYFGVIKDSYRLFYGIMCCLFSYAYVLIQTPASWTHTKSTKNLIMIVLQEILLLASALLFISIFMGPDNFRRGSLLAIGLGAVLGLATGLFRYFSHLEK